MTASQITADTMASAVDTTLMPDGPILIATDLTPASDAAFPLAAALAARSGAPLAAVSVVEPAAVPMYGVDGLVVAMEPATDSEALRLDATRTIANRLLPKGISVDVTARVGDPSQEVAAMASALRARLIVTGRGRHGVLERLLGGETVLKLLQFGVTPVLATAPTLTSSPRRVVIATDFSPFSRYAAHVAMRVMAPDAQVWFLHVGPPYDGLPITLVSAAQTYRDETATAFEALIESLPANRLQIETVLLTGGAPDQLISFIEEKQADLVVTATHGYGFIRRMVLGSVAATLIRHAPCSVLAVPGSAQTMAASRARGVPNARTRTFDVGEFDQELAAFSTRNAGRRCAVEIDNAEFGAQVLGSELQFVGASFEKHASTAVVMFGTSTLRGMHLSHSIPGVTSIDLSSNAGGEDMVLRIADAHGQTLISLR